MTDEMVIVHKLGEKELEVFEEIRDAIDGIAAEQERRNDIIDGLVKDIKPLLSLANLASVGMMADLQSKRSGQLRPPEEKKPEEEKKGSD